MGIASGNNVAIEKFLFFPANATRELRASQALAALQSIQMRSQQFDRYSEAFDSALDAAVDRLSRLAREDPNIVRSLNLPEWAGSYRQELSTSLRNALRASFDPDSVNIVVDDVLSGAEVLKARLVAILCSISALWLIIWLV